LMADFVAIAVPISRTIAKRGTFTILWSTSWSPDRSTLAFYDVGATRDIFVYSPRARGLMSCPIWAPLVRYSVTPFTFPRRFLELRPFHARIPGRRCAQRRPSSCGVFGHRLTGRE
jgi:hypothetical protein